MRWMEGIEWYYRMHYDDFTEEQFSCFGEWIADPLNQYLYDFVCRIVKAMDRMAGKLEEN